MALGFLLAAGIVVMAQDHNNATERKAKDQIEFTTDVRVGTTILAAGMYEVSCDTQTITFLRLSDRKKVLEVPCKGEQLSEKRLNTAVEVAVDKNGVSFLQKLILGGGNIAHSFN
jgi:hypothetical protein